MSNTQQFPNLPQGTWTCWQTNLVPTLQSHGCDSIEFSGGNDGTASFHHSVPFSNGQFAFSYSYDPAGSVLSLTITDKPNILPASTIFGFVQELIYTCPQ
jgi:hypothetical protein